MSSKEEHKDDEWSSDSIWGLPKISYKEKPIYSPLLAYYDSGADSESESDSKSDGDSMPGESLNEDSISGGGEAKRKKLEHLPLGLSDPGFTSSSGGDTILASKRRQQEEMAELQTELFEFNLELSKCTLIKHDSSLEDLLSKIKNSNLPADRVSYMIDRKIYFKERIFSLQVLYDAVKLLYNHVPYITFDTTFEEAQAVVNWDSSTFKHFNKDHLYRALEIYKDLLFRAEGFFHPLIRKSYKDELFSFLTEQAKLEERKFIMTIWRTKFLPGDVRKMLQLAVDCGYRGEKYQDYCRHIQLHEEFDYYIRGCKNVKHDSNIEDLIHDETVFSEKFKGLDPDLRRLSLEAWIKTLDLYDDRKSCFTQLKLLETVHCKNETADIDKLLIDLHSKFPGIFSSPMDSSDDNALEEHIKDATHKMKEMWFPRLSYHRVLEITLLYMKHLVSESETEGQSETERQSWSTQIFEMIKFFTIDPDEIYHEHYMYQYVMDTEYTLA